MLQKWVEIDLNSFLYNFSQLKKLHSKKNILPVIKSNAYGHGIIEIAKKIQPYVDTVCVISPDEGAILRNSGFKKQILILGSFYPFNENLKKLFKYNLIPTVSSIEELNYLLKMSGSRNKPLKFHLKIDTGMHRLGILPENLKKFIDIYTTTKNLILDGLFTHLSSAYSDKDYTFQQLQIFNDGISILKESGINPRIIHAANSAASILYPQSHYDALRPGIALYGLLPFDGADKLISLKPILSWKTRIVLIKELPKNSSISYLRTYITKRKSKIAVIPIGYADGYSRLFSNKTEVLVRGKRVKTVGIVTMDMTMLDVTDVKNVRVGDEVVIIGAQGKNRITAEELAKKIGTINYEIVCKIHPRVPRIYI